MSPYEEVFDLIPDALLLVSGDETIVQVNPPAERLFKRAAEDMVGTPLHVWLETPTEDEQITRGMRAGVGFSVSTQRRRLTDGQSTLYIVRELSDGPALAESEFGLVFNATQDHIALLEVYGDCRFRIVRINHAMASAMREHGLNPEPGRIPGLDLETFLNTSCRLDEPTVTRILARFEKAVSSGETLHYEERLPLLGGSYMVRENRLTPILDSNGAVSRILLVGRDITQRKIMEESLRESETRWQFALDGACDGLWDWNTESGKVYFSRRWKEMLGYSDSELENEYKTWEDRIHPEDLERVRGTIRAYLDGREPYYTVEHRLRCKDGNYKWILARGKALDGTGSDRPVRMLGTHTDITGIKETLHALQESESRFRALIEDLDVGVVLQDPNDQILLSNEAAGRILGIENPAMEGISSRDPRWRLVNADGSPLKPEDVPSVIAARTGQPVKNAILGSSNIATGERRWLQISATPRLDATGRLLHTLVTLIDITAAHKTETALRESEAKERHLNERFALAAESAGIGVWGYVIHEDRLEWDENMYRIFQLDPAKPSVVVGDFQARVHPDDLDRVNDEGLSAAAQGRHYQSEYRILWPNGEVRHIKSYGRMILNESGETERVVGVCYDVTVQRKLEEQLRHAQKMEAVGQLAGGVAHDFNNLLTVINGYCEVLLLDELGGDPTVRAQIEAIHKAGERAALLTQQLLVFSRKAPLKPEIVDLNHLAQESGALLSRLIPENIHISFELAPAALCVTADRTQLEQLVMNLALNARDAMEEGGTLTIASRECVFDETNPCAEAECPPGTYACLSICDTGCGIPPEHLGRLFEPFFTTKSVGKGTGLGLATVYGVVQQCGGAIGVQSSPGCGTCFNVYLPEAFPSDTESGEGATPERRLGGNETILLVEDEDSVREVTHKALVMHGYTVLSATNGPEALRVFDEYDGQIHLVLTDLVMPGMGGRELAVVLLRRDPRLKIVFVSGYEGHSLGLDAAQSDAGNFVQKPFRLSTLLSSVRDHLDA